MSTLCPHCQQQIPANAPGGLCPHCLLRNSMNPPLGGHSVSPAFAVTTPQGTLPATPEARELARLFPQLEIMELIGHGGMGAVYKARQRKLDRLVAVKIIRPDATGDPAFAERFAREARTLARLAHPNIVSIHDFGEVDSGSDEAAGGSQKTLYFFLMEYVDGANLRQLMMSGKISPELAASMIGQICDALQYAHGEGIVHRDIKPENILFDSRGRVKIADFGLAKLVTRSDADWTLTGTHQVMGTPRYMAPEQMEGSRNVDQRADIYSLGVIFYEMLTGTIPAGHFDPPSRKSGVHPGLDEIVLRAMSADPDRRYQSATELRLAVNRLDLAAGMAVPVQPSISQHQTGFSTIIDREFAGTWRMMIGSEDVSSSTSAATERAKPFLFLLVLFTAAAAVATLPWISGAPKAINGVTQFRGGDLSAGTGAAVVMGFCAVIWIIVPSTARRNALATGILAYLSSCSLLMTILSWQEAQHELTGLKPLPGFHVAVILAGTITALTAAAFRQSLLAWFKETTESDLSDFARVPVGLAESGRLPDVCMVCGGPAHERLKKTIEYQPKWAESLMILGFILGGIPGVIIAVMTQKQTLVALPFCSKHKTHLNQLIKLASVGWLLPVLTGGVGILVGYLPTRHLPPLQPLAISGLVIGIVLGLISYVLAVIWLSFHRVKIEQKEEHEVIFSRVSPKFAVAVRERTGKSYAS